MCFGERVLSEHPFRNAVLHSEAQPLTKVSSREGEPGQVNALSPIGCNKNVIGVPGLFRRKRGKSIREELANPLPLLQDSVMES